VDLSPATVSKQPPPSDTCDSIVNAAVDIEPIVNGLADPRRIVR
jgi:hypothetical protein